jgi:hypothetical protein
MNKNRARILSEIQNDARHFENRVILAKEYVHMLFAIKMDEAEFLRFMREDWTKMIDLDLLAKYSMDNWTSKDQWKRPLFAKLIQLVLSFVIFAGGCALQIGFDFTDVKPYIEQAWAIRKRFDSILDRMLYADNDQRFQYLLAGNAIPQTKSAMEILVDLTNFEPGSFAPEINEFQIIRRIVSMVGVYLNNTRRDPKELSSPTCHLVLKAVFVFAEKAWRSEFRRLEDTEKMDPSFMQALMGLLQMAYMMNNIEDIQIDSGKGAILLNLQRFQRDFVGACGKCSHCLKPASLKCSRCGLHRYCSAQCQKSEWSIHRMFCGKYTFQELKNELISSPTLPWETPMPEKYVKNA